MSRRDQIVMNEQEVAAFLTGARTVILTSIGKDGVPHPVPMWFAVEKDGALVMTTFTKSQKIQNLKRDPRVSLLVEDGSAYVELRGVVIYSTAGLVQETEAVIQILHAISLHRGDLPAGAVSDEIQAGLRAQAEKRTGIRVRPAKIVSWDHRKLGGSY